MRSKYGATLVPAAKPTEDLLERANVSID